MLAPWEDCEMVRSFDTPINTNDQSIDRVLATGLPVALVFLDGKAPALEDTLNRLAREHAGQVLIALVQMKDNPATARRFQVNRAPAVVAVRNGQAVSKADGIGVGELSQHVFYLLGKGPQPQEAPKAAQAAPRAVSEATFEQDVMRSSEPVLVDFWAAWCGPCRSIEPAVERIARDMAGKLRVAKVNVDENPALAQRLDIQGIPTMIIVKNGRVVDRWSGALPEQAIRARLAQQLR
jgi:thioredoxin 1